uniref:Uncharacterized protein n=1 Tax=uncultured Dokdonia sp. TaxID=575653 RepID=F4MNP0_9FLAO|nr:hypothetical protein S18_841_0013 [uncultured Dokdonia sp.]
MNRIIAHISNSLTALLAARPAMQLLPVPVRRFRRRP